MTRHEQETERLALDVRLWVLPRWRRVQNLVVLVVVTAMISLGVWTTLHSGEDGLVGWVWVVIVAVVLPIGVVAALRQADRVELHPDGTLLLSGMARVVHTHVTRVRRMRLRRRGEGRAWLLDTDDGRVHVDADLPGIGELLDVLARAGAVRSRP